MLFNYYSTYLLRSPSLRLQAIVATGHCCRWRGHDVPGAPLAGDDLGQTSQGFNHIRPRWLYMASRGLLDIDSKSGIFEPWDFLRALILALIRSYILVFISITLLQSYTRNRSATFSSASSWPTRWKSLAKSSVNHFYMVRTPPVENDEPLFPCFDWILNIHIRNSIPSKALKVGHHYQYPTDHKAPESGISIMVLSPLTCIWYYLVLSLARCCYAGQCRLKRKFRCFLLPDTTLGYTESLDRMLAVIAEGFKPLFTISAKSPQPVQTMRWGCGGLRYNIPTLSSTSNCRAWTFSTMTSHALPAFQSSALTQPEGPSPQSYTGSWWSSWHITGASKVRFQKVRCLPTPIW